MKYLPLLLILLGCAMPTKESLRPREVEFYSETGKTDYGHRQKFRDWRIGAMVRFYIIYEDEEDTIDE